MRFRRMRCEDCPPCETINCETDTFTGNFDHSDIGDVEDFSIASGTWTSSSSGSGFVQTSSSNAQYDCTVQTVSATNEVTARVTITASNAGREAGIMLGPYKMLLTFSASSGLNLKVYDTGVQIDEHYVELNFLASTVGVPVVFVIQIKDDILRATVANVAIFDSALRGFGFNNTTTVATNITPTAHPYTVSLVTGSGSGNVKFETFSHLPTVCDSPFAECPYCVSPEDEYVVDLGEDGGLTQTPAGSGCGSGCSQCPNILGEYTVTKAGTCRWEYIEPEYCLVESTVYDLRVVFENKQNAVGRIDIWLGGAFRTSYYMSSPASANRLCADSLEWAFERLGEGDPFWPDTLGSPDDAFCTACRGYLPDTIYLRPAA